MQRIYWSKCNGDYMVKDIMSVAETCTRHLRNEQDSAHAEKLFGQKEQCVRQP